MRHIWIEKRVLRKKEVSMFPIWFLGKSFLEKCLFLFFAKCSDWNSSKIFNVWITKLSFSFLKILTYLMSPRFSIFTVSLLNRVLEIFFKKKWKINLCCRLISHTDMGKILVKGFRAFYKNFWNNGCIL